MMLYVNGVTSNYVLVRVKCNSFTRLKLIPALIHLQNYVYTYALVIQNDI